MNHDFQKLEKNAIGNMYAGTILATVIVMGILTVIGWKTGIWKYNWVCGIYIALYAFATVNCLISPYFRYHRYRYKLDEHALEIMEGYLFVTHSIVPIERIQNIEVTQGPIDRLFGISSMSVTTGGGNVDLHHVSKPVIDAMSDNLKKKVNALVIKASEEVQDGE